jgi:hypothetical protein
MKTTILDTLRSFNRNLRNPMNNPSSPCRLFIILPVLACFAFVPGAQAACLDGCNNSLFNVWQGDDALLNNATGAGNSAFGWRALFSNIAGSFNTAVGGGALVLNDGTSNTAVGAAALLLNTTGVENTAIGTDALVFNDGDSNTAVGFFALSNNATGVGNTATGHDALLSNIDGSSNTAVGRVALTSHETGSFNTAIGNQAMETNTSGTGNVAVGSIALSNVTTGDNNVGLGRQAFQNTTGNENIGVGHAAGVNMTTGSNNICIGSPGDGSAFTASDRCFIGNIRDVLVGNGDGIAVIVDSDGQLGTGNASSRRFKEDIKAMDKTSEAILRLKPVTFHYKKRDTKKADDTPQFGLVAEDVAEVNPDLVMRDKDGQVSYVRYDAVNAMLLNEFLKEHKKVEEQQTNITQLNSKLASQAAIIAQQQKGMEVLTAQLKEQAAQIQKVSAQLQLNNSAARTVASDH